MLDLEMRQLEYFVTAASAGSYAQAAKQLFVSPQAISKSVQILEGRIGVALFERGPNGIALTP
ncbi:MAG: LysR family transcriptional regulator, partial [Raoultibacter sp.]